MIKTILLLLFLSLSTLLFSAENKEENKDVYYTEENILTNEDTTNMLLSGILKKGGMFNKPLCKNLLLGRTADGKSVDFIKEIPVAERYLIDFNFDDGTYSCSYFNQDNDTEYKIDNKFNNYKEILKRVYLSPYYSQKVWNSFDGEFKPNNIDKMSSENLKQFTDFEKNFSIRETVKELGMDLSPQAAVEDKSITLSQFVVNLITLNGDFVTGVHPNGDIKINPEIEKRLMIIQENNQYTEALKKEWLSVVEGVSKMYNKYVSGGDASTPRQNYDDLLKDKNSFSYVDYFDRKLYGLYYNFMNIGWGNVFSYAGMLFLVLLFMYAGGGIGIKYMVHRFGDNNNQNFDFPMKQRLVNISITMALSFMQYPTGSGVKDANTGEEVYAQTTIAKNLISYMAGMGTKIADYSSVNITSVYMEYLINASYNQSVGTMFEIDKELKKDIVIQRARTKFFSRYCKEDYSAAYENLHSFIPFSGKYKDSQWEQSSTNAQSDLFENNEKKGMVALSLCAKIEKDIMYANKMMKIEKRSLERSIGGLTAYFNNNKTNNMNLFAVTQLIATKEIGWFSIAGLPALHIYLKNTGIVEMGEMRPSASVGRNSVARATMQQTQNKFQNDNMQKQYKELSSHYGANMQSFSDLTAGLARNLFSKGVYVMMPGFDSVFKFTKSFVSEGVEFVAQAITIASNFSALSSIKEALSSVWNRTNGQKKTDKRTMSTTSSAVQSVITVIVSFYVAIILYSFFMKIILAGVVAILTVLKIVIYLIEVFVYYFVSPFVVGWQLTINSATDKVHKYISNGFVLLFIKPSLIVFSAFMFIIGYEIMESTYALIFDIIYSNIEIANKLIGGITAEGNGTGFVSFVIMANIQGIGDVLVTLVGLILAYRMIMDGDKMILDKFGYRDDTESSIGSQILEKTHNIMGKI